MSNWIISRLSGAEMNEIRQTPSKPQGLFQEALDDVVTTSKNWWLLLVTGTAGVIIAILFGVFCFFAAANEVMVAAVSTSRGWRILHWLLAVLFVIVGVVAFFRPEDTFVGLAAVMSFYFIFRGSFDIAMAFAASRTPGWWVLLLVGLAEIGIGFWAAGSWKVSVVVLVSWVAAAALVHGIGQISSAFLIRRVGHNAAAFSESSTGGARV